MERMFTTPRGANIYCPFLGVRARQEITRLQKEKNETLERELQRMFEIYEPRVEGVSFSDWESDEEDRCVCCRVRMLHKQSARPFCFRVTFRDNVRENRVQPDIF